MYFRCAACSGVGWVEHAPAPSERVDCETCARSFVVRDTGVGPTLPEQYRAALELANSHRLDLPRAYSVVLGLFPDPRAEQAQSEEVSHLPGESLREPGPAPSAEPDAVERAAPESAPPIAATREQDRHVTAKADGPPEADAWKSAWRHGRTSRGQKPRAGAGAGVKARPVELDPAFEAAIESGRLTLEQAINRGDREAFARSLVQRHRIDFDLAYEVADNRISLREAVAVAAAERQAGREPSSDGARRVGKLAVLTGLCAAGLAVGTLGGWLWNRSFENDAGARPFAVARARSAGGIRVALDRPEPRTGETTELVAVRQGATDVRRDAEGRVVEIVGPDAAAVLRAWCAAAAHPCVPTEITETVPRLGDARYGAFIDPSRPWAPAMIWIRQDWRTRRWIAGDGKGPIPVNEMPELGPAAYRQGLPGAPPDRPTTE